MRRVHLRWLAAVAVTVPLLAMASPAGAKGTDCKATPGPGVNLHGCDLSYRQFQHVNFSGADLADTNLTGSSLFDAVLFGANLQGANLSSSNLETANFTGAKLNHAQIDGATVVQANFSGATLIGVSSGGVLGRPTSLPGRYFMKAGLLFGPGVNLVGQSLAHLDLAHANLSRANLAGADLSGANLSHTSLSGTNLIGAILTGARITDTGFHDAELFAPNRIGVRTGGLIGTPRKLPAGFILSRGYFVGPGANLAHADLSGSFLPKVNFTGADLDAANFANAVLWGAEFSITSMLSTGFAHASLHGANFSNVNISSTILRQTDLSGVRSSAVISKRLLPGWVNVAGHLVGPGANLSSADLSYGHFGRVILNGATLIGTNLTGANLSRAILPGVRTGRLIVEDGPAPLLPRNWLLARGCLLGPGTSIESAHLQNDEHLATVDLRSAHLFETDLQNANLSHAILTRAELLYVNVQNANLSHAALGGIVALHLIGTPASLPPHWAVVRGVLVHR